MLFIEYLKDIFTYDPPSAEFSLDESADGSLPEKIQNNSAAYVVKDDGTDPSMERTSRYLKKLGIEKQKVARETADTFSTPHEESDQNMRGYTFEGDLQKDKDNIQQAFNKDINADIICRDFLVFGEHKACCFYIDGMINTTMLSDYILRWLLDKNSRNPQLDALFAETQSNRDKGGKAVGDVLQILFESVVSIKSGKVTNTLDEAATLMLDGFSAICVEGCNGCLVLETIGFERRQVEKSENEKIILGPKQGFCETLKSNVVLLRQIIRTNDLINDMQVVGADNNIKCSIVYRKDIANPALVREVQRRVKAIKTRLITSDGMMQQLMERHKLNIMPQILQTERPDRVAALIMNGHVAVLVDGSPYALVAPVTFYMFINSPEDYYLRWQYALVARMTRFVGLFGTVLFPAVYLAIMLYQQNFLPEEILISIISSRKSIGLSVFAELIVIFTAFELVREAGIRIPGGINQALGIIGALILGQAAVAANIVSPIIIIIIAISGLGAFAVPNYTMQLSLLYIRVFFIFMAAIAGFFGISIAFMFALAFLCNTNSFGVPFFAPFAPKTKDKGAFFRGAFSGQKKGKDYLDPLDY